MGRIDRSGECWIFTGTKVAGGYGRILVNGRHELAHRASYEMNVGPIPDGLELDHLCRNRACVNPDHLEPVTHLENCRRAGLVRFTGAEVREIRQRYAAGEGLTALSRDFGSNRGTLWRIATGAFRKEVTT